MNVKNIETTDDPTDDFTPFSRKLKKKALEIVLHLLFRPDKQIGKDSDFINLGLGN
jgi:glucuronate isomerase